MKTFRFLGIAIAALFMSVNFTSCNNEGITPEDQEEKYIEVDLACFGEILDITNSPLAKADDYVDKYHIQVYKLSPMPGAEGSTYYTETGYARGTFNNSLDGVKVRLLEGNEYRFKVSIANNQFDMPGDIESREFTYTSEIYPYTIPWYNEDTKKERK